MHYNGPLETPRRANWNFARCGSVLVGAASFGLLIYFVVFDLPWLMLLGAFLVTSPAMFEDGVAFPWALVRLAILVFGLLVARRLWNGAERDVSPTL